MGCNTSLDLLTGLPLGIPLLMVSITDQVVAVTICFDMEHVFFARAEPLSMGIAINLCPIWHSLKPCLIDYTEHSVVGSIRLASFLETC